jgi:hypothetical protein
MLNNMITQLRIDRLLSEINSDLADLTREQIQTLHGILNRLIYIAAQDDGMVFRRSTDGKLQFNFKKIVDFFRPGRSVIAPVNGISTYLKEHWAGRAYYSRDTITSLRYLLSERFKLFTLEDRRLEWRNPLNRHRVTNPCADFNMLRAILLARACEEYLLAYGLKLEVTELDMATIATKTYEQVRVEYGSFPEHKAYTMAKIGDAAGLWTDSVAPHPELVEIINLEYFRVCAEKQFNDIDPDEDGRSPEQILEDEWLPVTEVEETEQDGVIVLFEKLVDVIPWKVLVRRSMFVPARKLLPKLDDGGIRVPLWALEVGARAMLWWEMQIGKCGWMQNFAPLWVLDTLVPF